MFYSLIIYYEKGTNMHHGSLNSTRFIHMEWRQSAWKYFKNPLWLGYISYIQPTYTARCTLKPIQDTVYLLKGKIMKYMSKEGKYSFASHVIFLKKGKKH